ncbi:MAG: hypothetical protein IJZ37_05835 [Clostridia bacterium]|nr:hypothetical protein [Clostridia bacterium]MBQ8236182.1 hypothetical protein [Clostridia bacterium]
MAKRKKRKWDREEILSRLLEIAEDAHRATISERIGKNGEALTEYDTRCATIELKALECAVKLAGIDLPKTEEICITLDEESKDLAQ